MARLRKKPDSASSAAVEVPPKRARGEAHASPLKSAVKLKAPPKPSNRCKQCRQKVDLIRTFDGDHEDAKEEFIALSDDRITSWMVGCGEEEDGDVPQHKLTNFSFYDKEGHLCPFEGLIERGTDVYGSGWIKPVFDDNPSTEGGVAAKLIGPLTQWWLAGFDHGAQALLGVSSATADYFLMAPSESYTSFLEPVLEKSVLTKSVIESLSADPNIAYEDLIAQVSRVSATPTSPKLSEDTLLREAQFIVDQVSSYDDCGDEDEEMLMKTEAMEQIVELGGVNLTSRRKMRSLLTHKKKSKPADVPCTATPLVRRVFEEFFEGTIKPQDGVAKRLNRCKQCEACKRDDCGSCTSCLDMVKFGGTGRSKQSCQKRVCKRVKTTDEDVADDDDDIVFLGEVKGEVTGAPKKPKHRQTGQKIAWVGKPDPDTGLYASVRVGKEIVKVGDFVLMAADESELEEEALCAQVMYMWEEDGDRKFHGRWLIRGTSTVLGSTADRREFFAENLCDINFLDCVMGTASVEFLAQPEYDTFRGRGGKDDAITKTHKKNSFYCQKEYDVKRGRFIDLQRERSVSEYGSDGNLAMYCPVCERLEKGHVDAGPKVVLSDADDSVSYAKYVGEDGTEYSVGDAVYIHNDAYQMANVARDKCDRAICDSDDEVDEELYPEKYRKTKQFNYDHPPDPYHIAQIQEISRAKDDDFKVADGDDVTTIRVRKYYRPEHTVLKEQELAACDINEVYWSEKKASVQPKHLVGRCTVLPFAQLPDNRVDYAQRPDCFYFKKQYLPSERRFDEVPEKVKYQRGQQVPDGNGKGKGKGKGKAKAPCEDEDGDIAMASSNDGESFKPLKTLDVFAGCGGLSEGLHQSGAFDSKWAIEFEPPAAEAYKKNYPETEVFCQDCNSILQDVIDGKEKNSKGQLYPRVGEVDALVGGPPCQGYSGMNRFNSREYSQFKNSLVVTYLSYCDVYRPKYFILENVRNFVAYKGSMVLRLVLRALVEMGYQCEFGVLHAGHYGVPQSRRRAFIIAAAPGEVLPSYPEPTHCFPLTRASLTIGIDDTQYIAVKNTDHAPLRSVTVRDAIGDLPRIGNGASRDTLPYDSSQNTSTYQKMLRRRMEQDVVYDHVSKAMNNLVEERMKRIPTKPGADWRDLPNIEVAMRDGSICPKLEYTHHDKKNGKAGNGHLRGVCPCATTLKGDHPPEYRQTSTLIPWCLPHTGNKHNDWSGLYGRLAWSSYFKTTITNPEPMGKQGRVLHPEQHRVVSVRECARSQGFPDHIRFVGTTIDRHRQVGNAVPPPLARAIGVEVRKAMMTNKPSHCPR